MQAQLTYYVVEGVLTGSLNGHVIHMAALSGGGGGSTRSAPADTTNNPYMTGLRTQTSGATHVHGGPIPLGRYTIAAPAHDRHLGFCAALIPQQALPGRRGGFFIHGRGPHGSDGCIVPVDKDDFTRVMAALTTSRGGALVVLETMDDTRFA